MKSVSVSVSSRTKTFVHGHGHGHGKFITTSTRDDRRLNAYAFVYAAKA